MPKVADTGTLDVSVSAWLEELASIGRHNDEGHTARELADLAGVTVKSILMRLQKANAAGRLVVGTRTTYRIDRRPTTTPVYRVTTPQPSRRKEKR